MADPTKLPDPNSIDPGDDSTWPWVWVRAQLRSINDHPDGVRGAQCRFIDPCQPPPASTFTRSVALFDANGEPLVIMAPAESGDPMEAIRLAMTAQLGKT